MNMERSGITGWTPEPGPPVSHSDAFEDVWIFDRLNQTISAVTRALDVHRYHEAAQRLWDFFWHDFCDWYLEIKKLRFQENSGLDSHWRSTLAAYEATIRLLHPIMPFVTEELWQRLIHGFRANAEQPKSISLAPYPTISSVEPPEQKISQFTILQDIVKGARDTRADNKLILRLLWTRRFIRRAWFSKIKTCKQSNQSRNCGSNSTRKISETE